MHRWINPNKGRYYQAHLDTDLFGSWTLVPAKPGPGLSFCLSARLTVRFCNDASGCSEHVPVETTTVADVVSNPNDARDFRPRLLPCVPEVVGHLLRKPELGPGATLHA
jgi:hypothetical protein